jgi:hypothetical protein
MFAQVSRRAIISRSNDCTGSFQVSFFGKARVFNQLQQLQRTQTYTRKGKHKSSAAGLRFYPLAVK